MGLPKITCPDQNLGATVCLFVCSLISFYLYIVFIHYTLCCCSSGLQNIVVDFFSFFNENVKICCNVMVFQDFTPTVYSCHSKWQHLWLILKKLRQIVSG